MKIPLATMQLALAF